MPGGKDNMTIQLHNLQVKNKSKKRVGRGNASGHGTYSCRGMKGQRSRSGGKGGLKLRGFKQNLLNAPKFKGIKSIRPNNQVVKLSTLEKNFNDEVVNPITLLEKKLISSSDKPVKILTFSKDDKITKKFDIQGCLLSQRAKDIIEKAGGKITEVTEKPKLNKTKIKK